MTRPDPLARAAVEGVRTGMIVGLGTGRAASRAIAALAERARAERLRLRCVATSAASAALASSLGLLVLPLDEAHPVDLLFDGADEVDPRLRMIKGRGGAMTREKIVAHAARRRIYLVQRAKLSARLGLLAPLPIEALAFGLGATRAALAGLGLEGAVRTDAAGGPALTDDGNPIIDAALPDGVALDRLREALDAVPGVVGHGLFLHEADEVLAEDEELSERIERFTRR